jgi:hypothetical protein
VAARGAIDRERSAAQPGGGAPRPAGARAAGARPLRQVRPDPLTPAAILAARIAALEAELRDLRRQQRDLLLVAIAASVQGHAFSAAELLAHAGVDDALRQALDGAGTPKRIGRRLQALAGREIGGLRLVRVGRDETGCIWAVHLHDAASLSVGGSVY